jgi:hypothetical protein
VINVWTSDITHSVAPAEDLEERGRAGEAHEYLMMELQNYKAADNIS